jgi:hypothetical protein
MKLTNIIGIETNDVFEITYEGKKGYFIPPDLLYHYHNIATNLYLKAINETIPTLERKVIVLQKWADFETNQFNKAIEKYEKIIKTNRLLISITAGSILFSFVMLAGMILFAVLPAYYKYAYP